MSTPQSNTTARSTPGIAVVWFVITTPLYFFFAFVLSIILTDIPFLLLWLGLYGITAIVFLLSYISSKISGVKQSQSQSTKLLDIATFLVWMLVPIAIVAFCFAFASVSKIGK